MWIFALFSFFSLFFVVSATHYWGIMSVFPIPLPIKHDAPYFPYFFSSNESMNLASLPFDKDFSPIEGDRHFNLTGSLCFSFNSSSPPCVQLTLGTALAWRPAENNRTVEAPWIQGWWPNGKLNASGPLQPRWAPFCKRTPKRMPFPWTECQSRKVTRIIDPYFTFSPDLRTFLGSRNPSVPYTNKRTNSEEWTNPFDNWLLCGTNGSCSDLRPFAMIGGGMQGAGRYSRGRSFNMSTPEGIRTALCSSSDPTAVLIRQSMAAAGSSPCSTAAPGISTTTPPPTPAYVPLGNVTFEPTPVCVWQPFFWLVINASDSLADLNCTNVTCFYASCWDATRFPHAVVVRMPRHVPMSTRYHHSLYG